MTKTFKKSVAFLSAAVMVMAMLLYFPGGTFSNIDWGLKASAEGNTLTEPSKDSNGVYQIGTAGQLYWFAALVNGTDGLSQNSGANAVLTADITVNTSVLNNSGELNTANIENFTSWTPIGNSSKQYTGTFDGQNHTISGLYFNNTNTSNVGLFGRSNGIIKNVGVEDSYFKGKERVGGVCGESYASVMKGTATATITNCYNTGAVSGTSYVGGVCGESYASSSGIPTATATETITNCYNTGAVSGTSSVGGVCGQNRAFKLNSPFNNNPSNSTGTATATITNCYNTGAVSGTYNVGCVCGHNSVENVVDNGTATATITNCYYDSTVYNNGKAVGTNTKGTVSENVKGKTTEQFGSGEVCYLLNNGETNDSQVWYQTIKSDSYPLLDSTHGTVYASAPCPINFSNTKNNLPEVKHSYVVDTENDKQHKCTKCGDTHNAVFTANDTTDTISVCCGFGSVTLKAPTEPTYDGTAKAATVDGKLTGFATPKILYKLKGISGAVETAPTNAGTYVASITYTDKNSDHTVRVEYTIDKADPVVTADTNQNVVCGFGTFTEPVFTDVDGNTLAGTIKYEIPGNSDATADDVKKYFKDLKSYTGSVSYTFTPVDTKNYNTASGTINFTVVDVAFMVGDEDATAANAVTIKENPTYGDTWKEILTLNDGLKAVLSDKTVTDGFSFAIDGVSDTSVKPNAGNYTYNVLFNGTIGGKTYTDHVVATGTVDVAKKELTVSAGTYKVSKVYDETTGAGESSGELEISGIINDDDVTVNTGTIGEYSASDVGTDYEVSVAISLDGTKKENYTLGTVSSINVPAEITKATQSAPFAPTVSTFDCHSVTLEKVDGYEYSKDGETWQDSNVFTGLTNGETYKFCQRIKATANYEASAASELLDYQFNAAEHDYTAKTVKSAALYKSATCTSPAVYYYSCSVCDNVEEDSTHTFENGSTLEHNDTDNDNRCDTCGHIMDGIGAKLAGYSLSLSGNIGVNFYMELSDEVVADETALMEFTLPNGEKPQVMVSDAEKVTLDNKEYYVFTCEVAAKEMDDIITAQIITADSKGVVYKYTVRDYADYILDEANGYDDNTKAVVSAMLSYGDYAKAYFSGEELTATSEINAVTSDMLAGYAMTESGILPEGIEYYGSTLLLESETTIRHYFKVTEGTDISAYNMTEKGGYYYIQCSDIPAGSLGTAQDISVGEYTISYSPMSYAYAALNSDSTSDNLKNLVKALYIYYQNAYAYNNSNANAA